MAKLVISFLVAVSRHGRAGLAFGLVAGLLLPEVASAMKPLLPYLVMALLFLVALRIGPTRARHGLLDLPTTLALVLILQLVVPLLVVGLALAFGIGASPYVLAAVLVLSAPSVSGSPNFATILNADPEPAFRMLIVGTALLPFTMLPVLWLLPQFDDPTTILVPALRALIAITCAMGIGFFARATLLPNPSIEHTNAMDGAMTVALAIIVVALMAALRPAMAESIGIVIGWLALAFGVNIGMQVLFFGLLRGALPQGDRVPVSIVAGNRNFAIYLVALSPVIAEPLLIFLGCYQVPMYLTPLLMSRLFRSV
jgi:ACR3 family arsenite transporter